jgi:hypothetical protein
MSKRMEPDGQIDPKIRKVSPVTNCSANMSDCSSRISLESQVPATLTAIAILVIMVEFVSERQTLFLSILESFHPKVYTAGMIGE